MMNWMSWDDRWAAVCRIRINEQRLRRLASVSPGAFRRNVRVRAGGGPARFGEVIEPWQEADFAALDAAWVRLAGSEREGESERESLSLSTFPPVRRAWIERPRGHAKTSDMAVQIAWVLLFARRGVRGLAAAADREQAELIWQALVELARLNPLVCGGLDFRQHAVVNRRTGSALTVISSDVSSSWGSLPDFVICDELCHWERADLWYSLYSSAAKRRECVLAVLTNAGIGRGWQWDAREAARTSAAWHFSSLEGARAPWIAADALEEQRLLLPPAVYARLWENRWQHSDGEFVTLAEAEGCRDPALAYQTQGRPGQSYIAAIDYAEKHDLTVGVVVHVEGQGSSDEGRGQERPSSGGPPTRIIVDRMDVVSPGPGRPVPVAWVERWIAEIARQFHQVTFVVDEYQLLGTIQRLETVYDVRRFEFRAGRGNHALALNLRKLIVGRGVAWYAGCGECEECGDGLPACRPEVEGSGGVAGAFEPQAGRPRLRGRDDLETELAGLLFRQTAGGLCRIDHRRDGRHHDDRSFALGAACLHAVQQPAADDWLAVTPPDAEGEMGW